VDSQTRLLPPSSTSPNAGATRIVIFSEGRDIQADNFDSLDHDRREENVKRGSENSDQAVAEMKF